MKRKFSLIMSLFVAATALFGCAKNYEKKAYNEGINVIPVPVELNVTDSLKFTLTANTVVAVGTPDFANVAAFLTTKIQTSTGYALTITEKAPESNFISFEIDTRVPVGNEGYLLSSTTGGVVIKSRTPQGAFYGAQTLLQLLPAEIESQNIVNNIEWSLPCVEVKDEPRFKYRGLMLDPCRHFQSVEFVKRQLDILSMFKMNRFHWHLTEDQGWRIEIKKYPKLTELGSVRTEGDGTVYGPFFYTQEQIKEVVAYATNLYIDVIPEIELPGHALAALTAYPEYSCTGGPFKQARIEWGVEEDVYCVGNDATFEFLEDVIDEVVELFPSEYFHIGGDECPKVRWKTCPKCQARIKAEGLTAKDGHSVEERLQSYTVARIEKYLNAKGKKLIGWDEILEGGLTPSATVMSWRGITGGLAAANSGNDVIMTPNSEGMYFDHYQGALEVEPTSIGGYSSLEKVYNYDPIPEGMPEDKQHFIVGAQANIWTEYMLTEDQTEYMIYPRVLALAEDTWSLNTRKDWADFQRRINNALVRLDMHSINYHIPMPEGVLTQNIAYTGENTTVEFSNTRNLPMVYTLDGTAPVATSAKVEGPITLTGNGEVKVATMLASGKMGGVRSVPFAKEELAPAIEAPKIEGNITLAKGLKPGVGARLQIAEGLYSDPETYSQARFGKDTIVNTLFDSKLWDQKKPSLARFEGYIEFPEDGVYTFTSDMDELWIDGVKILENKKLSRHSKTKVQKALKAGKHTYVLVFNNMIKDGWPNSWSGVGFKYKVGNGEWISASGEALRY